MDRHFQGSMTQGKRSCTLKLDRYEDVPSKIMAKLVTYAWKDDDGERPERYIPKRA